MRFHIWHKRGREFALIHSIAKNIDRASLAEMTAFDQDRNAVLTRHHFGGGVHSLDAANFVAE